MADKIKQPIKKGISKVPVIMQLEALECGAACLAMVLAYYQKWIPLEQVRMDCGVSRDGSNAGNIMKAAKHYGLTTKGYKLEPQMLRENGTFPCIIHWNYNHFVVLNGFKGNKVYLNDPARGTYTVTMEAFDKAFTGVCLMFSPSEEFVPSGKPKSTLSFAGRRLKGAGNAMAFTVLVSVIAALMNLINPVFSRIFIDRLLSGQAPEWLNPFLIFLFLFSMIQIIVSALQAIYSLRLNGKMTAVGNATYMWKVLRLPMSFYAQRMVGDIQARQITNASIANTLITTFSPLALNTFMMFFYLVIMIRYSWLLSLIGLSSLAINAIVSFQISKVNVNLSRVTVRDSAKLESTTVAGVEMIETIKAAGAENGFYARWAGFQASLNAAQVRFSKTGRYLGLIPMFASKLADIVILILGVWLIMQGQFTIGMITTFQVFLNSFMGPASTLISAGQTLQQMRTQMERIDDVMEYPLEQIFTDQTAKIEKYEKLSGRIELKNVEFGYAPLGDPLIRDFNLTMTTGKSVALVGSSGCGKSTVSKLLTGLYHPWKGEILFDGKPLNEINPDIFHASVAIVDQDIILFEDTIANNIKMWDESIEDFEMILAARDAQIHEEIMQRPDGYQHRLIEGGKDFSGGQRQRLEIARVLAQDPSIIIMDEATSALDAKTEYEVVKSIRERGITCIVVAHRLSTVRSCDEIIVMDHGLIIARGTHQELMNSCERYRDLVTSE